MNKIEWITLKARTLLRQLAWCLVRCILGIIEGCVRLYMFCWSIVRPGHYKAWHERQRLAKVEQNNAVFESMSSLQMHLSEIRISRRGNPMQLVALVVGESTITDNRVLRFDGVVPEDVHPTAEFEIPRQGSVGDVTRFKIKLENRC